MEYEDYILRIVDTIREVRIQLWGALLVTNGVFISALVVILGYYGPVKSFTGGRIVTLICILFLSVSSILILINYFITSGQYQKIIVILRNEKPLDDSEKKANILDADRFNKKINIIERLALFLLGISFLGLFYILINYVDLLNWFNDINIYQIMNIKLLNDVGLLFSFLGGLSIARGMFITKKQAIELGTSKYCGQTDKENLKLPQVKDRLKQRKYAIIGAILLMIGLIMQLL